MTHILTPSGGKVPLAECPVGLFFAAGGALCMKTEYGSNEGRIDAYIVSSGEAFWGAAPQTIASQRDEIVQPVAYDAIGSGVKALEWRDSGAGNHSSAHSDLGLYVASQTRSGNFRVFVLWIDPGGNDADREICEAGSLLEAKAAAQADFERRVLSCLSPVAVEEGDAKAGEPVGFAFEVLWHNDTWCLDFSEMPPVAPAGGEIRNVRPLYAAAPATPSPQIGKAGAGPVKCPQCDFGIGGHEPGCVAIAGAGPVGEAVAWRELVSMRIEALEDGDQFGAKKFAIAELRSILDHATRPVEEPAEAVADARDEGWQPIETAPTGGKFGCFLMLAFGPQGDQTVSEGMHFQGRFYAASVFYTGGPHDTKQFTFREHEVKPTHWRHTLVAPGAASPQEPGEVERLKRERNAQYDENVNRVAAEGAAILRAEAAEAALRETRAREKRWIERHDDQAAKVIDLEADLSETRSALKAHHDWHLAQEEGPDGVGGAEAYADSPLCSQTVAALRDARAARTALGDAQEAGR